MKIVVNASYGGFGLSDEARALFRERAGIPNDVSNWEMEDNNRTNPILIDIVEQLGKRVNRQHSKLRVVDCVDDYNYTIEDYDGIETVYLSPKSERLFELIRNDDEEALVTYVMRCGVAM